MNTLYEDYLRNYSEGAEQAMFKRPIQYRVLVTLKTFHGAFKPTVERFEFCFVAEWGRYEASRLAASNVESEGWSYDEVGTEVLESIPQ